MLLIYYVAILLGLKNCRRLTASSVLSPDSGTYPFGHGRRNTQAHGVTPPKKIWLLEDPAQFVNGAIP